ncbi:MAG: hypothetical protein JRH17_19415 [Deltaproteobacteria bacterium]|nr:hypothetical protein [Deltaproteobacteria bacterium]
MEGWKEGSKEGRRREKNDERESGDQSLNAFKALKRMAGELFAFEADVLVSPGLMVWVGERSDRDARVRRRAPHFSSEAAAG